MVQSLSFDGIESALTFLVLLGEKSSNFECKVKRFGVPGQADVAVLAVFPRGG